MDEIPEVEMEDVQRPPGEPGRVGSKRIRDSPSALDSYGFYGATTAEKKPMLQPHDVYKSLNKAGNINHLHMNSDGASKIRARYLHGAPGMETPDSNALREGLGSAKAGLLAPAGSGNHRGSDEGSQVQQQSNLKVPQFKDADGSLKHEQYQSLSHVYGEYNERSAHLADEQNSTTPGVSQGFPGSIYDSLTKRPTAPINELVQSPAVHEKNHKPFMGHHIGLAAETYLGGSSTFPRLLDGGNFQSGVDKRNSLIDSHVSRTYLDVNTLNSDYQFRPFGLSISSDPLQLSEKFSAYGGTTKNLPNTHQKEHRSSHISDNTRSLTGFRNPCYVTSEIPLGSPTLRGSSQLGMQSHRPFTTGSDKVNLLRYIDADKGCGTSRPALLSSSSPEPSFMPAEPLAPIKDEVWETSVPFVPSFTFPVSTTPPGSPYDPFVDCMEPPKVGNTNNLKPSNVSFSISSQHTNQYVIPDKSLNHKDKLTSNMSAKGANGLACLIASDRGRSTSLDCNNKVKACDRKNHAASNDEKARDFRVHLAEHIKELIKPIWKEGNLSKDAHKQVVKKCVDKVVDSIEPNQVATKELIAKYITTNGSKIEKLVQAYVDKHRGA
ncbi:Zinc finger CCCH domain-containing protein 36 [Dichanthelium oligosanthes]|uniref:Zinc finger CCCH domain-containing protein 36 n=1 Tax=Dichanthelium oligosanthes TaxID=888268 RepID=A0A1E5UZF4_9POAL|nr:Zinc finger CCCH domain-containing protein 36 [Dichanthelium oligosanthes]